MPCRNAVAARTLPCASISTSASGNASANSRRAARVVNPQYQVSRQASHDSWLSPGKVASSVPPVWEVTEPSLAVVRLHGRNAETWDAKAVSTAAERFGYLYDTSELRELARGVRRLSRHADEVHVLFNNCYRDNAQVNAARLRELMQA